MRKCSEEIYLLSKSKKKKPLKITRENNGKEALFRVILVGHRELLNIFIQAGQKDGTKENLDKKQENDKLRKPTILEIPIGWYLVWKNLFF